MLNSSKTKLFKISSFCLLSLDSYTTVPSHSFSKGSVIGSLLWLCTIALTMCVFYIGMEVKWVLLHMTGSAMNEDNFL